MIDGVGEERRGVIGNLSGVEVLSFFRREMLGGIESKNSCVWVNDLNH